VVIVLAFVASLLAATAALRSLTVLRQAISELDAAVAAVHAGNKTSAVSALSSAQKDFSTASGRLDAWWADPAELVPGVRQHLLALRAAASVGDEVSASGLSLDPDLDLHAVGFGPSVLSRLSRLSTGLSATNTVLLHAEHQLAGAQSGWLISSVESRLTTALSTVRRAQHDVALGTDGVNAARALLGGDGPRRYFLAVETEAELRGNGGILGNYGVLSAESGRIHLVTFGRDTDLNAAGDPATRHLTGPASFLARYGDLEPQTYWQNVLASPDFPNDASVIEQLYPQSGGTQVNGVITIDPAGLAALLSIVGPISVPSWPVPITSANATEVLLHTQYDVLTGSARVDFLGEVAAAAWQRLSGAKLPGLSTLASVLGSAIADKHLMFSSTDRTIEDDLTALGAAGSMSRPAGSDFLAVTNENTGGNKIDYYLRRSISYTVSMQPATHSFTGEVAVTMQNLAPATGQPAYVIGSVANPSAPEGVNDTYVSIYTPWSYTLAFLNGQRWLMQSGQEAGLNVYSTSLSIPPGGTATVDLFFSGTLQSLSSYKLQLFRQPTVTPDTVTVHLAVPSGFDFARATAGFRAERNGASAELQLDSNTQLSVGISKHAK
jgi:hypothetical protein